MAQYEFLTTWCVDAPIDRVFAVLDDAAAFPQWWKGVTAVEMLEQGDDQGVGALARYHWCSVLPYTLSFDARVTRVDPPHLIEARATGDLEGVGVWRLFAGRDSTAVVYDWRVRTTKRWMNMWGPLPRPAFAWNHDQVMRRGGRGLAERLDATLIANG